MNRGCIIIRPPYVPVPARRRVVPRDMSRAELVQAAHRQHLADRFTAVR